MALPLPTSLSPSKVSTFRDYALAFRFSAIDKLPEPPSEPAVKGTTVHRALELLLSEPAGDRTPELARGCLDTALGEMRSDDDFVGLGLDEAGEARFTADAEDMLERYFTLKTPAPSSPWASSRCSRPPSARSPCAASSTVSSATPRVPSSSPTTRPAAPRRSTRSDPGSVACTSTPTSARPCWVSCPSRVQLVYLGREPQVITATPNEQSVRGLERKVGAIWSAVERACATEDFRPKPSALCNWCAFTAYCPSFGGNPDDARLAGALAAGAQADVPGRPPRARSTLVKDTPVKRARP